MKLRELLQDPTLRIGLVLGGGGAKGAHQIGVWRGLREAGLDRFDCIAGTSIGSLNALLVAISDPDTAAKVWVGLGDILRPGKTTRHALASYALTYGAMFLPAASAVVFGTLWAIGLATSHADPPGLFAKSTVDILFFGFFMSVIGVMLAGWMSRTFEHLGTISAYTFNPQIFFRVGLVLFWVLCVVNALVSPFSLAFVLGAALAAMVFWMALGVAVFRLSRRARRFALFDNAVVRAIVERQLAVAAPGKRHPQVTVTVARERSFYHPAIATSVEMERYKEITGQADQPGKLITRWVPEYVDFFALAPGDRADVLLDTSAIPIAFPARKDARGFSTCDGGIVDNLPIVSALNLGRCDVILVLPANRGEAPERADLQERLDEKWAEAMIPQMTATAKRELWTRAEQGNGAWMPLVPGRRDLSSVRIVVLEPSRPLCTWNVTGLRFVTGTLNFRQEAVRQWLQLGDDDCRQALDREIP